MKQTSTKLLTFDEAANLIHESVGLTHLTREWVRSQVDQGKLGSVTVARKRHVRLDKLEELITSWLSKAA